MVRYLRAFARALQLTLQGKTARPQYPALSDWMAATVTRVDAVYSAAEARGLTLASRQQVMLHLDKRDISMETILASVRQHASQEYPYLLRHLTPHSLLTIHATNLNDGYRLTQLQEAAPLQGTGVQQALAALRQHLDSMPEEQAEHPGATGG